jgi:pimeloyl-ACP methyl ester carboxylesterase
VTELSPQIETPDVQRLIVGEGPAARDLAYRRRRPTPAGSARPGIVWLGGFKSDMLSTKAERLDLWAAEQGRASLRFDYSGHGESGGRFEDGTISSWLEDSLAMFEAQTEGPQVLVGSSMGGWIALLLARALAERQATERLGGMVLIAPAVDFTEALMWAKLPPEARDDIETRGVWMRPTPYAPEPYPVTRALIEDGRRHLLLDGTVRSHCPVHILQGMQDPDVPWDHAMTLVHHLAGDPVSVTLVKDGDHRLSREEDIERLLMAVAGIA